MATKRVTDLTALSGANSDVADEFLVWDASANTHKKMTRAELAAAFMGLGNVATNVAMGATALDSNTTGANNTAIGVFALTANTTGAFNVALGASALAAATTATYNTAIGYAALLVNTTGSQNTAVGGQALAANTTGANNTAVGLNALAANTVGAGNTAMGWQALLSNTTGASNTAVGQGALAANTTGVANTSVGQDALGGVTTGTYNTAIGFDAGSTLTTGSNNTLIGYAATPSAVGVSNEITLGNSSIATIRAQVTTITSLSDERDKKNIRPLDLGLDLLLSIEPKWFEWDMRPERDAEGNLRLDASGNEIRGKVDITEAGFIAQQLQGAVAAHAGAEALGLIFDSNPDRLEATPGKLMPVFVKAFHDLHARLSVLEGA